MALFTWSSAPYAGIHGIHTPFAYLNVVTSDPALYTNKSLGRCHVHRSRWFCV